MITDGVRHRAHVDALRRYVRADSVVLDLGTGSGIYALIAAQLGARQIYAIDPNPCIQIGRQLAQRNGLSDRIDFRCALSTEVTFPERADFIVSDLRDTLPFNGKLFSSVADARRRHLAPGGVMIPTRDTVFAALVEAPAMRREIAGPWDGTEFGLDLTPAVDVEANVLRAGRVAPESLLTAPLLFAELDYASSADIDLEELDYHLEATLPAERDGTADAIALWFDATVIDEITYTSGPYGPPTVYGTRLLPLRTPLTFSAGDEIRLDVQCRLLSVWHWWWQAEVTTPTGTQRGSPSRQTTVGSAVVTDELLRVALGHAGITKRDELERDEFILERLSGGAGVPEIAAELQARHGLAPGTARDMALQVAARYTQA
jgi:protein arginine N-methyltransferase 1